MDCVKEEGLIVAWSEFWMVDWTRRESVISVCVMGDEGM